MTVSLSGLGLKPTRKIRRWISSSVYRVYAFRSLFEAKNNPNGGRNPQVLKHKIDRLDIKLDFLAEHGSFLGLSPEQIKAVNSFIVEQTKKGRTPKDIIQLFYGQKGIQE